MVFSRAVHQAIGLCAFLLLIHLSAFAQKITVEDPDDFEELSTRRLKLVCLTDENNDSQVGKYKGAELVVGVVVKILNVPRLLKRFRKRRKAAKARGEKSAARRFGANVKDLRLAQQSCGSGGEGGSSEPRPEPSERILGANTYWISESGPVIFTDAMRQATRWYSNVYPYNGTFDSGQDIPMSDDGYPTSLPYTAPDSSQHNVMTLLFTDTDGRYPAGTYTFSFSGTGEVVIGGDTPDRTFTEAGTYQIEVTPGGDGIAIEINTSDVDDPIRDMHFVLPGYANTYTTQQFTSEFLSLLDGFSVLRMSNLLLVNGGTYPCDDENISSTSTNCEMSWTNRSSSDARTYNSGKGVPYEAVIDLANAADIAPWFTIQHAATDEHIRSLASLIRDRLESNLNVYVEYSNEVWNGDDPYLFQKTYAEDSGIALGFDSDRDRAKEKFISHMTCKIGAIFDDVFGSDKSRVKVVMPAFSAVAEASDRQLAHQDDTSICASGRKADVLAMAAYFGIEIPAQIIGAGEQSTITVEEILTRVRQNITTDIEDPLEEGETSYSLLTYIQNNCTVAQKYGIPLVAYEGGQHVQEMNGLNNDLTLAAKLVQANHHADMGTAFTELFSAWYGECGGLLNIYTLASQDSNFFGMFGLVTDLYDDDGNAKTVSEMEQEYPKFQAVRSELSR